LLLLCIGEASIGFCNFFELPGGLFLFCFVLVSVPIWMELEGKSFIGLLDLLIRGISIDLQDLVVVLLLRFLLLLLRLFDFGAEIYAGIEFLDLVVVHNGCGVLSSLHVQVSPSDEGFIVVGIELQRSIQVI
jgi:hypothetical protein